ncbi:MAG: AarF/ABC1/UbiB kinase family protein [Desulfobacterales bacterium]|nr:AarF/ABC1/UbiB kinase family protein [Desulfobacterales bacterium]
MADKKLTTSAFSRMFKLGGLVSRIGVSMAGNAIANTFRSVDIKEIYRSANIIRNANRLAETLGNLKGLPMKIGQMLSLHEKFLPEEVAKILSSLQQKAPSVPFYSILEMIKIELGDKFRKIKYINHEPYAAASIGQVHKAILNDETEVVFKIQYPGIDKVIAADMKNLKGILKIIFSMLTKVDLDKVWEELNERLLEELDYEKEASNMLRMAEIYQNNPNIIIPEPILDLSTSHILCMKIVEGISPERACSNDFSKDLRDKWGQALYKSLMTGFFIHRFLHTDPNIANFAFREDGSIIIYDFGCVKEVPAQIVENYAKICIAGLNRDYFKAQQLLKETGIHQIDEEPLSLEMISSYSEVLNKPFRTYPPYTYGKEETLYAPLIELGQKYWQEITSITFPKDIIFIHRTIGGHYGNLIKLEATGPWRQILEEFCTIVLPKAELLQ